MNGMRLSTMRISDTRLLSMRYLQGGGGLLLNIASLCRSYGISNTHLTRFRPIVPMPPAMSHRGFDGVGAAIADEYAEKRVDPDFRATWGPCANRLLAAKKSHPTACGCTSNPPQ